MVIDDVFDATGNKQELFMYGSLPGAAGLLFSPAVVAIQKSNRGKSATAASVALGCR
jgi:hypothetical protein